MAAHGFEIKITFTSHQNSVIAKRSMSKHRESEKKYAEKVVSACFEYGFAEKNI